VIKTVEVAHAFASATPIPIVLDFLERWSGCWRWCRRWCFLLFNWFLNLLLRIDRLLFNLFVCVNGLFVDIFIVVLIDWLLFNLFFCIDGLVFSRFFLRVLGNLLICILFGIAHVTATAFEPFAHFLYSSRLFAFLGKLVVCCLAALVA
jgi:hypothetical protein